MISSHTLLGIWLLIHADRIWQIYLYFPVSYLEWNTTIINLPNIVYRKFSPIQIYIRLKKYTNHYSDTTWAPFFQSAELWCLLNSLFINATYKISKFRITVFCGCNLPMNSGFSLQRAINEPLVLTCHDVTMHITSHSFCFIMMVWYSYISVSFQWYWGN